MIRGSDFILNPNKLEEQFQLVEVSDWVDFTTKEKLGFYYTVLFPKLKFEKVKELTIRLSMVENSAYRLAANIKKTQKRANALKNITIPHYQQLTKDITNALEEKEREEFTRLKVIKRMQTKKKAI